MTGAAETEQGRGTAETGQGRGAGPDWVRGAGPDWVRDAGPDWVRDAVFYQIFPDRYAISPRVPKPGELEPWDDPPTPHGFKGGDLLGIAEHLDDLQALGITALYLTPIFASASNHRYHTFDYETVDPLLGGDEALGELLDEAHRRGMRVILDGVFNHVSSDSPWFDRYHHYTTVGACERSTTAWDPTGPAARAPTCRRAAPVPRRTRSRRPGSGAHPMGKRTAPSAPARA